MSFIYKNIELKEKYSLKRIVLKFLFPLFPVKTLSSIYLMCFLGALFALRLVLGLFSVPIVPFGFKVSFAWLPVYICGFFYGPVIGLLFGIIMDTTSFLIFGGVWFWMYAIQEPLVGLISGLIGSVYFLQLFHSIRIQLIVQKIFIYGFILTTAFVIITEFYILNDATFQIGEITNINVFAIIVLIIMSIFIAVNEFQNYYYYKKYKNDNAKTEYSLYLYISLIIIFCTVLFSFLLGPISYVKYLEYINGSTPSKYLQYGNMYYLVPRVLKESIKTPLYIIIFIGIVYAIRKPFSNFVNNSINKW